MEIVNTTPYVFLPFDCSPAPSLPALTLIVKGTFELRHDAPAAAVEKRRQRELQGDDIYLDDLGRSLRYSSDLVPVKLRGEVLVAAFASPRHRRAQPACDVAIRVGPIQKALRVHGDRTWSRGVQGRPEPSEARPFERMPIRWERAYGGLSHPANPLGRGLEPEPDSSGRPTHYLPNIEYLDKQVTHPDDRLPPAGFGPISPMWEPRLRRQGTRDQRWAMFRAPLPPQDFDGLFYNAAPEDQQLEGYFRGDEPVVLTQLHPDIPVYDTALPGKRLRLFLLLRQPKGAPSRFVEIEMNLDTVHIDVEAEEMVLVWRRPFATASRAHPEIEACYIAEEELAEKPGTLEEHHARFKALRGPEEPPRGQALDEEITRQMDEVKKVLRDGNVDPGLVDTIGRTQDPQEIFKVLMSAVEKKIGEIEALTARMKGPPGGL